jgi:hypothetical protein
MAAGAQQKRRRREECQSRDPPVLAVPCGMSREDVLRERNALRHRVEASLMAIDDEEEEDDDNGKGSHTPTHTDAGRWWHRASVDVAVPQPPPLHELHQLLRKEQKREAPSVERDCDPALPLMRLRRGDWCG